MTRQKNFICTCGRYCHSPSRSTFRIQTRIVPGCSQLCPQSGIVCSWQMWPAQWWGPPAGQLASSGWSGWDAKVLPLCFNWDNSKGSFQGSSSLQDQLQLHCCSTSLLLNSVFLPLADVPWAIPKSPSTCKSQSLKGCFLGKTPCNNISQRLRLKDLNVGIWYLKCWRWFDRDEFHAKN